MTKVKFLGNTGPPGNECGRSLGKLATGLEYVRRELGLGIVSAVVGTAATFASAATFKIWRFCLLCCRWPRRRVAAATPWAGQKEPAKKTIAKSRRRASF